MAPRPNIHSPTPSPAWDWRRDWGWRAGAVALALLALLLAVALAGFHPSDPTPINDAAHPVRNHLGLAGALTAAVSYDLFGLGAWWLVLLPAVAACLLWRSRGGGRMLPFWIAGLWVLVAGAAALGAAGGEARVAGAALPWGGQAGLAMAQGLAGAGRWAAWLFPLAALLAGLMGLGWSCWPMLGPLLRAPRRSEALRDARFNGEPGDEPVLALAEPVLDLTKPMPAQPETVPAKPSPARPEAGPHIKPRLPGPQSARGRGGAGSRSRGRFHLPPLDLLDPGSGPLAPERAEALRQTSHLVEEKLADFGVQGKVKEVAPGPVVTRYEFKPAPGVKISKVAGLADDLAMVLKARSIRIVAPIPGKAVIGIEIPNPQREMVPLRELLASTVYQQAKGRLAVALGKDILGQPVVEDLTRTPHLLIAGATGSGKSVFINCLALSILYNATPDQVRILMVDPKRIELSAYADIPHLLYPIITSPKEATAGLRWAVREMERRYELLASLGVKNIDSFNHRLAKSGPIPVPGTLPDEEPQYLEPLPYVLVFIDELADLMMVSSKEVEAMITRLAQMARAAGIHLVLATQRPSVDVITGLIKANFPARISFKVASRVDSRTILDQQGAEHLLGEGDMLFVPPDSTGLTRLHGAYVSEEEIARVTDFWREQARPEYDESIVAAAAEGEEDELGMEADELYPEAVRLVTETGQASISYVQRRLKVGYNRAANMIEQMERDGIVGPSDGSKPRQVLIRE
ncbi:MAG: DNA translocase FtsK 4TM domain-containing protein [Thermodesulfobacteriota bacterium]